MERNNLHATTYGIVEKSLRAGSTPLNDFMDQSYVLLELELGKFFWMNRLLVEKCSFGQLRTICELDMN